MAKSLLIVIDEFLAQANGYTLFSKRYAITNPSAFTGSAIIYIYNLIDKMDIVNRYY